MSVSPQQMQQMLAMYKQQFPNGQAQSPVGFDPPTAAPSTPAGVNKTAGAAGGATHLIMALMQAQKQKNVQQQLDAAKNSGQVQGPAPGSIPAMYPSASDPAPATPPGTLANPQGF